MKAAAGNRPRPRSIRLSRIRGGATGPFPFSSSNKKFRSDRDRRRFAFQIGGGTADEASSSGSGAYWDRLVDRAVAPGEFPRTPSHQDHARLPPDSDAAGNTDPAIHAPATAAR